MAQTPKPGTPQPSAAERLIDLSGEIREIKTHLKWHRNIGWGIASIYALVFAIVIGWVLTGYLPDKLNDTVPANFKERFGALEQNVKNIQDQVGRLTPSSLSQIIPSPRTATTVPSKVTSDLREANRVIDAAFRTQLPSNPQLLAPLRARLDDIAAERPNDPQIQKAVMSTAAYLNGHEILSKSLLEGNRPVTAVQPGFTPPRQPSVLASFTMVCTHPAAHFVAATPPETASNVVLFDLRVKTCSQRLDYFKWVSVQFDGATLEYSGGPLSLAEVRFHNCKFEFGSDERSRSALSAIQAADDRTVNFLIQ